MSELLLTAPVGANKKRKIVGRGTGSGHGTTACRGNKGQQSRSGGKTYVGFEGGQMPLYRRLAHRGFKNHYFKTEFEIVNLLDIERAYSAGDSVNAKTLVAKGLIKHEDALVKVLGNGEITKKLGFEVAKISKSAKEKIEKAGGTIAG